MALNLDALAGKTASTTVEFMGQSAVVKYDPSALTAEAYNGMQKSDSEFIVFFSALVKDWDVKKGTKKVPITKAGLNGVPLQFLRACFAQIMRDGLGDVEEGKASSGG